MTKESAEKIISKHFHKDWKNSYIGLIWNKMKNEQRFQLSGMDIIKTDDDYEIQIVKKDSEFVGDNV